MTQVQLEGLEAARGGDDGGGGGDDEGDSGRTACAQETAPWAP